jgi:threonylcarbamoyladenosine tRNA methylthiotransferase MtaB
MTSVDAMPNGHLPVGDRPSLRAVTLGCKVNQYETQLVREALLSSGYRDAEADESAALCLVNTCTVTAEGDAKSRQIIRRMARHNPAARIVVMGCYAARAPQELAALPQVAEVITDKRELPDLFGRFGVVDFPRGISQFGDRHRAYVKVQDGCLLRCSYCIIPLVRPHFTSRPMPDILQEVSRLVDNGYREIVLTGIHLGHYGVDFNRHKPRSQWLRLAHLVRAICRLPGPFRVRLSSMEATEVTRDLLSTMGELADRVCPHLHVCMQSGSDAVLRRMRRRWGVQRFVDRCHLAQQILDRPALTTDVMVGFPGETEEDFQATCDTSRQIGFAKIHIFPFSPRRGTPAADLNHQIDARTKTDRVARLGDVEQDLRHQYQRSLLGMPLQVLVEGPDRDGQGSVVGTACRYLPVRIEGPGASTGHLLSARAVSLEQGVLQAARRDR